MVRATAAASAGGVLLLLLLMLMLMLVLLPRAPLLTLLCSAGPHHQERQGQGRTKYDSGVRVHGSFRYSVGGLPNSCASDSIIRLPHRLPRG